MEETKTIGTDFSTGKIMPLLLRFFLPFLLANLLNSIYNTVDTIIIGQFVGSYGTVAVTLGGRMLNLFTFISTALGGAGEILISQQIGAKRRDELSGTIGTLFSEMFLLSVALSAISLLLSRNILTWLNTPEESFSSALSYFRITSAGLPLIFGYNAVSSVLRGMGDSKKPLLFIAIAAVLNLVGDLVFVVALGIGAAGTAYATVIGQGVSLVFSVVFLYRRRGELGFDFRASSFRIERDKLAIMMRIGLPMALRACCIQITSLILVSYVNLYGLIPATAYSIGDKLIHVSNIFTMAIKQASGTMIGQNIGAGKNDRVRSIVHCGLSLTLSVSAVLSVLSLLFPYQIFGLFSREAAVLEYAPAFMRVTCLIFFLVAVMGPYDSVVTGTGNAVLGFIGGVLDGVVFRLCFSALFVGVMHLGVIGFFMGDALARLGPILIGVIYYYTGAWEKRGRLVRGADEKN